MASIIPQYENDIYISYCPDETIFEWVKEFAHKLQQELDAVIKDKLTIFYDKQDEEGEFDQKSSQNLRSLIFIPVISQTYCDPQKYNWGKEFLVFKQTASSDDIGLNIELQNGTLINRILPVKIHQIEKKDIQQIEKELDGNMQSVDFIYDSPEGLNRPLRTKDDEALFHKNTILYRNQINKTANAIATLIKNIKQKKVDAADKSIPVSSYHDIEKRSQTASLVDEQSSASKLTVFLSWTASDCIGRRNELFLVLQKAGMDVVPITDCPTDDEVFKSKVTYALAHSFFSIHLLGAQTGRKFETLPTLTLPMYQFYEARKKISDIDTSQDALTELRSGQAGFKQIIWQCPLDHSKGVEPEQQKFINDIRNNITVNMIFTTVSSSMQLVDDIRTSMMVEEKPLLDVKETEVCLITNQLDKDETKEFVDLLSDVVELESLIISPGQNVDYIEMSVQQIKKSKLAVVYFKHASDWALPYTQQIWKMIGGASSKTPVLLIGDGEIEANQYKLFNAPKVISKILEKNLIALEIKATYDKAIEGSI